MENGYLQQLTTRKEAIVVVMPADIVPINMKRYQSQLKQGCYL